MVRLQSKHSLAGDTRAVMHSLGTCRPACLQGYAFVVFGDSVIVPRAIEELDCKVVEGKILVSTAVFAGVWTSALCILCFDSYATANHQSVQDLRFRYQLKGCCECRSSVVTA